MTVRITQVNRNVGNVNNTLAAGRCATCRHLERREYEGSVHFPQTHVDYVCVKLTSDGALYGVYDGNCGADYVAVREPAAFGCVLHEEKEKP